ncbi:MAG: integrase arm-type DNA-binding domain-containing protein [Desulfovibrio sp.]|jgi:integrase|nr:integrase arm-type DNA-binding domain-containing protein [Desulfovibrio sp.]
MPLTDTTIKALKPKDRPYKESDGGGMYLEVAPGGGKWWRLKYRLGGKEKRISLGVYPDVGLKEARERREQAKKQLAQGIDPAAHKQAVKAAATIQAKEQAVTFEAVAREWYAKKTSAFTPGHQKKILSRLEKQLFPHIGDRPFSSLEPADILAAVQRAEDRGAIETAHRLVQLAGQVCRYARLVGYVKYDIASGLTEALPPVRTEHYAAITDPAEIGHLLRSIDAYQGEPSIVYALKIMPYVFVRSGELRAAEWQEIDMEAGEWIIPAGRMKMRRPHIVPLARKVVDLLEALGGLTGDGRYLFPSSFSASRCISDMGLLNALRRMGFGKEQMTVHGFRSTASTLLNEQGYRPDVIEAQLAHGEKNAIRGAYNRAEYLPERRRMMQEWADYLDGLRAAKD